MKVIAPIILAIVALALGIGWYTTKKQAVDAKTENTAVIASLSNDVRQTRTKLDEQQVVNLTIEQNLAARVNELQSLSNDLKSVSADLARTKAEAKAAAEAAAAEIARRDTQIAELEGQREDLTGQMGTLNEAITRLEEEISRTEEQLAQSEGDREFLLTELKRLQIEKAELERQFNDLAVLREQVRRLREELSIARRLDWIRQGIYGSHSQRGAERLVQGIRPSPPPAADPADLEVELIQDGSVTIRREGTATGNE